MRRYVWLAVELKAQSRGPLGGQKIRIWCSILRGSATTRLGSAWLAWLCWAGLGSARLPLAPFGLARFGLSRVGLARALARLGSACLGLAPSDKSLLFCLAGIVVFYCKFCGFSEIGKKKLGGQKIEVWGPARPALAGFGHDWPGLGWARLVSVGRGCAQLGLAQLGFTRPGLARLSAARRDPCTSHRSRFFASDSEVFLANHI